MKESAERVVKVGFSRSPKKIFDQVDGITAGMVREGWVLADSILEEGLGKIHLFFERDVQVTPGAAADVSAPSR